MRRAEAVERLLDLVAEDAAVLGCAAQAQPHATVIVRAGTSAVGQLCAYEAAFESGEGEAGALRGVIDWLAAETAAVGDA